MENNKEEKMNGIKADVTSSAEIPAKAKQIGKENFIQNIDQWFCPDCGAHGTMDNIDYITIADNVCEEDKKVQYCCAQCFEENLYATFNED